MIIKQPEAHYDIAIIGGGMVGASFALALDHLCTTHKPRILVVESFAQKGSTATEENFDARTTALSFGSRKIFSTLNLWQEISEKCEQIDMIHVSDRGHFGVTRIRSEDMAVDALGYVVENQHLGLLLHKELQVSPSIHLLCPAKVSSLQPTAAGMDLQLEVAGVTVEQSVSAKLVVLADGGKSDLCEQLGIQNTVTHYEQKALISNISFTDPHGNIAYERFTDTGPMAVLPLLPVQSENRGALIWTLPQAQADAVLAMTDAEFIAALQERFGRRLGRIIKVGARNVYPLSLSVASEQIRPGLVLLGNVAHTLHPVAGQGLNLALRDALALAETINAAMIAGSSPGAMSVLKKYLLKQKGDQANTINFSHYITKLFSSNKTALVWARKFGLFSIDLLPQVRTTFTRHAMGLADRNSRLH